MTSPLEFIRTRLQSGVIDNTAKSAISDIKSILQSSGAAGPWRGLSVTLARDVPFSGIYWTSYELINTYISDRLRAEKLVSSYISNTASNFASGAISGAIAAIATMPLDVAKTRLQVTSHLQAPRRMTSIILEIYQKEGLRSLFSGKLCSRVCEFLALTLCRRYFLLLALDLQGFLLGSRR